MVKTYAPTPIDPDSIDHSRVVPGTVVDSSDDPSRFTSFKDRLKDRAINGLNYLGLLEEGVEVTPSVRGLRREIKKLDAEFGGLVGEIADTGTKSAYLDSQVERFDTVMEAHGDITDDEERERMEREEVARMVQPLVKNSGLIGDERDVYESSLVNTFHDYLLLGDEEREELHDMLDQRYEKAGELKEAGDTSLDQTLAERLKELASKQGRRIMGGVAMAGAGFSTVNAGERLTAVKEKAKKIKDEFLADMEGFAPAKRIIVEKGKLAAEKGKEYYLRAAFETGHLFDKAKQELSEKAKNNQGRKEGETDEEYEKRMRRNGQIAWIGTVAVLGAVTALKLMGHEGGGNGSSVAEHATTHGTLDKGNGWSDLMHQFDHSDKGGSTGGNHHDVIGGGHHHTGAGESIATFNGERGTTSLSEHGAQNLKAFLDDYKVQSNDTKGTWGIAEKYLQSQGVKNPSVYQVDAVKDHILAHSSLTESSVLHVGDTIKIK